MCPTIFLLILNRFSKTFVRSIRRCICYVWQFSMDENVKKSRRIRLELDEKQLDIFGQPQGMSRKQIDFLNRIA